jgi:hypothetical protein
VLHIVARVADESAKITDSSILTVTIPAGDVFDNDAVRVFGEQSRHPGTDERMATDDSNTQWAARRRHL